jgi:hypothetical protein
VSVRRIKERKAMKSQPKKNSRAMWCSSRQVRKLLDNCPKNHAGAPMDWCKIQENWSGEVGNWTVNQLSSGTRSHCSDSQLKPRADFRCKPVPEVRLKFNVREYPEWNVRILPIPSTQEVLNFENQSPAEASFYEISNRRHAAPNAEQ